MGCAGSSQMVILSQIKKINQQMKNMQEKFAENIDKIISGKIKNEETLSSKQKDSPHKVKQKQDRTPSINGSQIKASEIKLPFSEKNSKDNADKIFIQQIKNGQFSIFDQSQLIKNQGLPLSKIIIDFIKSYYQRLIDQKLQALDQGKILATEFKNRLSWSIVYLNMSLMQNVINNSNINISRHIFKYIQNFQIQFLGFLKKKYPRGDNVDAGELSKQFKEVIDLSQKLQNDILTSAGFYFDSDDQFQIMQKIKLFINKIIDQTDKNYPIFEKLMKRRIFHSNSAQKGYFQIGRKIPQNISKYKRIDKTSLQINSNEIFRILIKWIQDLSETIQNPKEKISPNSEWCLIKKQNNSEPELIVCSKYYKQLFIDKGMFDQMKQMYQNLDKNKSDQIQNFNISILKGFNEIKKFSPQHLSQQQAQIIKFSQYNMKFLKQTVQKRLISLIKLFVKVSSEINKKIGYDKRIKQQRTQICLNPIKFKISDLLRCKFQGNKEQIMQVYGNFLNLQKENKIKIIKIKNRFCTDLSDAMIIFKIQRQNIKEEDLQEKKNTINNKNLELQEKTQNNKSNQNTSTSFKMQENVKQENISQKCYLICQCQLILTQKSKSNNKKLKNIETLNHYLYQLERSPFKVLGECILQLNYKYDLIKYTNKIKITTLLREYQSCQHQNKHQKQIIKEIEVKDQNFSMVCRGCWNFYQPFQNISKIKTCQKCFKYLCYSCSSTKGINTLNEKQNQNKQTKSIQFVESQQQNDLFMQQIDKKVIQKYQEYLCLIFTQKKQLLRNQTKQQDILNYLNTQLSLSYRTLTLLKYTQTCIQNSFHLPTHNLTKYFKYKQQIKVKQLIQFIYKQYHQKDYKGTIERIVFFILSYSKNRVIFRIYKFLTNDQRLVNMQNQQQSYEAHELFQLNYHDAIYYPKDLYRQRLIQNRNKLQQQDRKYTTIELLKKYKSPAANNKQFIQKSFYFGGYQGFKIVYDKFNKQNNQKPTLQQFLQSVKRKKLVFINKNLEDKDIGQLTNSIKINKNVEYKRKFEQLNLINLQNNKIQKVEEIFQNCKQLEALYLTNNQIKQIKFPFSLQTLEILELAQNKISKIDGLQNLKCLKRLDLSFNSLQFMFNNDVKISQHYKTEGDRLTFPFLTYLSVHHNKLKSIPKMTMDKIQKIYLSNNQFQDLTDFLSSSFQKLKFLDIQNNKIKTIILQNNSFKSLQIFYLDSNQLTQFPDLNAPNLQYLNLSYNDIKALSRQQIQRFKKLKHLTVSGNQNLKQIPIFNHPTLEQLRFIQNYVQNILDLFKSTLPKIKTILLIQSKYLTQFPNINNFNNLSYLSIQLCPIIVDNNSIKLIQEQNSKYSQLKKFQLSIKTSSKEQFNNQKQKIQGILSNKIRNLTIQKYNQKYLSLKVTDKRKNPIKPTVTNSQQKSNTNPPLQILQKTQQQKKLN